MIYVCTRIHRMQVIYRKQYCLPLLFIASALTCLNFYGLLLYLILPPTPKSAPPHFFIASAPHLYLYPLFIASSNFLWPVLHFS